MAQVVVAQQPQTQLKDPFVPTHLEPAAPAAPDGMIESWIHWIKELFAALAQLLTPETLEAQRVIPLPSLATTANYDTFKAFVYNDLDSRQDLVDRSITALDGNDVEARETEMHKLAAVLRMVADAGDWVKAHKAEFNSKGIEAVQINQTLLRSQQIVAKFLDKMPSSSAMLQRAPQGYVAREYVSPGLRNATGSDCFMNSAIQLIFGDPEAYQAIAQNPDQNAQIKLLAYQYKEACRRGTPTINIGKQIRDLFPTVIGNQTNPDGRYHQLAAHEAFQCLTEAFGSDTKAREEYERGNPFVHEVIVKKEFDVHVDQLDPEYAAQFEGQTFVKREYLWSSDIVLFREHESQSMESLMKESFLEGESEEVSFKMRNGETQKFTPTKVTHTFARPPRRHILQLKNTYVNFKEGVTTPRKYDKPIDLAEEFYVPPGIYSDEGHKVRVDGFIVHDGSASGGHYTTYRRNKENGEWYYYNDGATPRKVVRRPEDIAKKTDEINRRLQGSPVMLMLTPIDAEGEDIPAMIAQRIEESKAAQLERNKAKLKSTLSPGNSEQALRQQIERLEAFHSLLKSEELNEEKRALIKDVFKVFKTALPPFHSLVKDKLIQKVEAASAENFEEHLPALKDITEKCLTTEITGNIVQQYIYIRKKQLESIEAQKAAIRVTQPFLAQLQVMQNIMKEAKQLVANIELLIPLYEEKAAFIILPFDKAIDLGDVSKVQKMLLPGLDDVLASDTHKNTAPHEFLTQLRTLIPDDREPTFEDYLKLYQALAPTTK